MRDLRPVALSEDGTHLVLETATTAGESEQFRVPVDDRLRAALRGVRQAGNRPESALSPREIQARLRAGESAADVARAAGIPVERVERYEGPVLAERARVVGEARAALLPKDVGGVPGRPLGEVVDARLMAVADDPAAAGWDAWRRMDGIWLVQLTSESRCARWTWDPVVRRVRPHDDAARVLVAPEPAADATPPPVEVAPRPATPALTLVSEPAAPERVAPPYAAPLGRTTPATPPVRPAPVPAPVPAPAPLAVPAPAPAAAPPPAAAYDPPAPYAPPPYAPSSAPYLAPAPPAVTPPTAKPAAVAPPAVRPAAPPAPAAPVPGTQVPAAQVPAAQVPAAQVPAAQLPATQVPGAQVPAAPASPSPAVQRPAAPAAARPTPIAPVAPVAPVGPIAPVAPVAPAAVAASPAPGDSPSPTRAATGRAGAGRTRGAARPTPPAAARADSGKPAGTEPAGTEPAGTEETADAVDPAIERQAVGDSQPQAPAQSKSNGRSTGRKGRKSVPAWDDIVFGARRP